MKREIIVGKEYCTYVKTPLVADDVHAYNIIWETGETEKEAGLLISAKRSDGITVTDFTAVEQNGKAEYVMANNMYSVTGNLEIRLSVVCETTTLTEKILIFEVIEGNGTEAVEAENNVPLLTSVLAKATEAAAKAERIPTALSGFENDCGFISEITGDVIPDESITPEKTTFYGEFANLSKQLLGKTVSWEKEIILSDKLDDTAVNEIEIGGSCFQNDSIITYSNKTVTSGKLEIACNFDGTMILNGTLEPNEEVTLSIPEITFYAGNTYKSGLSISDTAKDGTFSVYAEGFTEGEQTADTVASAIKIVQGDETGTYENFELCYRIYEEERSGSNEYPVYAAEDPVLTIKGKNRISYDDFSDSSYCSVENKGNGLVMEGKYYVTISDKFSLRLEPGKAYTFSCKRNYISGPVASNIPRVVAVYEDGTSTQWTYSKPTAVLEDKKISKVNLFVAASEIVKCEVTDLMFEEGEEKSEYEDYVPSLRLMMPSGSLYRIGDAYDRIIISDKIYVQSYINKDGVDLSKDISEQKNLITLFPDETLLLDVPVLENFRNKTVRLSVSSNVPTDNKVTYLTK